MYKRQVVQIAGKPDSGKSTHAAQFMKLAQDQDCTVILFDSENKFSANRFDKYFGGKSDDLLVITSKMILEGAEMCVRYIKAIKEQDRARKILLVWDSIGGSLPKNEGDGHSMDASKQMAAAAKENGAALRGILREIEAWRDPKTGKETIAVLLINQSYSNIGSPGQTEAGGNKIFYYSSIILQLTRKKDLIVTRNKIKRKIGIVSRAKVKKNHLFDGEDSISELDLAIRAGGITSMLDSVAAEKEGWDVGGEDDNDTEGESED